MSPPNDADDDANDPVMRSMRAVWLTMRDEAPPSGGLTDLLNAARAQAEAMQPRESWWRRSVAMLMRPPLLALATVVVLIGGAVIIKNRGVDVDSPAAKSAPSLDTGGVAIEKQAQLESNVEKPNM